MTELGCEDPCWMDELGCEGSCWMDELGLRRPTAVDD
jgi:hypothetical protein